LPGDTLQLSPYVDIIVIYGPFGEHMEQLSRIELNTPLLQVPVDLKSHARPSLLQ
jgi:hypothetical protein